MSLLPERRITGDQKASSLRRYVPLLGNAVIVLVIAWLGPFQLGAGGLALAALISLFLYNSAWFLGSRSSRSRTQPVRSQTPPAKEMKKAIPTVLAAAGLVIFVVGGALPLRLPRNERNVGHQTIATLIGFGLLFVAVRLDRKRTG